MASTSVLALDPALLESQANDCQKGDMDDTLVQPAMIISKSQRPNGRGSTGSDVSASTTDKQNIRKSTTFGQKIKNMFKGKDSTDDSSRDGIIENKMDTYQKEITVKFRNHTRLVFIPAQQKEEWLEVVKVTAVKKFKDVFFSDGQEEASVLETMKDNLLFQVYYPSHGEFIDLTDDMILPDKAKLRIQSNGKSLCGTDEKESSVTELSSFPPVCVNVRCLHVHVQKQTFDSISDLSGEFKIRAIASDDVKNFYLVPVLRGNIFHVEAQPQKSDAVYVTITKIPVPHQTPKFTIEFSKVTLPNSSKHPQMAINNTTQMVEAVAAGSSGHTFEFEIISMLTSGYELYWNVSPYPGATKPTQYIRVSEDGKIVKCIDYKATLAEWAMEPGLIFAFYAVTK